jgi:hypothetical protein
LLVASILMSKPVRASSFALDAIGLVAPAYADPVATDAHAVGPSGQTGLGARLDGRFRPIRWLDLGVALDYLQGTGGSGSGKNLSRHVSLPLFVSFVPLRLPVLELGIGFGLGPSWSWYGNAYGANGERLRASGVLLEARLEPMIPLTPRLGVVGTLGARIYGETYANAVGYAADGRESPAAVVDLGIGLRFGL